MKLEDIKAVLETQPYIHIDLEIKGEQIPHVLYLENDIVRIGHPKTIGNDSEVKKWFDMDKYDYSKSVYVPNIENHQSILASINISSMAKEVEKKFTKKKSVEPIELAIKNNIAVLLIGPTGSGKTHTVRELAKKHKKTFTRLNLNGQTNTDEFVGKWILKDGNTEWVDGVLTTAMKNGEWILIDEINAAQNDILFVMQSLLDDDRFVRLSEKDGSIVSPHKDFRLFAAMNPPAEYAGTKELNRSITSRFGMVLNFEYLGATDEIKLLQERTKCTKDTATKLRMLAEDLRSKKSNDDILYPCSTRDLLSAAQLVKKGLDLGEAIKLAIYNKADDDDKESVSESIQKVATMVVEDLSDSLTKQKEMIDRLDQEIAQRQEILKSSKEEVEKIKKQMYDEIINDLTQSASKAKEKYEI